MGTIKDRNGKDLRETERLRKTIQKKKKRLGWPWWCGHSFRARHYGVWSQVSIRKYYYKQAIGGDGIIGEQIKILKDDAVKT